MYPILLAAVEEELLISNLYKKINDPSTTLREYEEIDRDGNLIKYRPLYYKEKKVACEGYYIHDKKHNKDYEKEAPLFYYVIDENDLLNSSIHWYVTNDDLEVKICLK